MSDQMQRGAKSANRWVVRALTVFGGAVAGTVAAWALASAGASADTLSSDSAADASTPVADTVADGVGAVTVGVAGVSGETAGTASQMMKNLSEANQGERIAFDVPRQVVDRATAGKTKKVIQDFADSSLVEPTRQTLGTVEKIVNNPAEASKALDTALRPSKELGKSFLGILDHATGLTKSVSGGLAQANPAPEPRAVKNPAPSSHPQIAPRNADRPVEPQSSGETKKEAPLPQGHSPLAPVTLPAVPGGLNAGGHYDASLFGIPAGDWNVANTAVAASGLFGVRHASVEPGTQPGVTPD